MSIELKDCPFCGGKATLKTKRKIFEGVLTEHGTVTVGCTLCGIGYSEPILYGESVKRIKENYNYLHSNFSIPTVKSRVIQKWNTRKE